MLLCVAVALLSGCETLSGMIDNMPVGHGYIELDENTDPRFSKQTAEPGKRIGILKQRGPNVFVGYWRDTDGAYIVYRHHREGFLERGADATPQILRQVASALAYGNVTAMLPAIRDVLDRLGPQPAEALASASPRGSSCHR